MKVFVTVGSMLPFDRLVAAADAWAAAHPEAQVSAQTGDGAFRPRAMLATPMLSPQDYRSRCAEADVIVSHLGMGTVITAAEVGRPLVALPRRRELGEVTSDHQMATAKWLRDRPGVWVVDSEWDIGLGINSACGGSAVEDFGQDARDRLVKCVRAFLQDALRR